MFLQIAIFFLHAYWACCPLEIQQSTAEVGTIALSIDNIRSGQGNVHIAIYDKEKHFAESLEPFRLQVQEAPADGKLVLKLDDLPFGRYAMAIYHDENGNGDLDKNLFGIPKEPYGFSNNPRAKWSAPTYQETSFELGASPLSLTVSLKKWKER